MYEQESKNQIAGMSAQERWELAKEKLLGPQNAGVVENLLGHIRTHQNTRQLVYSKHLADQIPASYAAHAFADLQRSQLHYEMIRLCTFWDRLDLDGCSIPTIVALAGCSGVTKLVIADHEQHYPGEYSHLAQEWGAKAGRRLKVGLRCASRIEASETLLRVKNYRDKLAHPLERTSRERTTAIPLPRFGDERLLLKKTINTVDLLYLSLSARSFDWDGSKAMHKRNADAFWKGVTIQVQR